MASFNNPRTMIVLLATLLVHHAAADAGEDFSNNLFSDLAPILALFGEQVAKQFMSQSMGLADNVIFAMAPLGIITAIVAAIRVSGPIWLKAVIGRARENNAAAEVELMSSTSHDVCELWNGQSIVRLMGSPPILEIIYLHDRLEIDDGRIHDCGLFTLEEAEKCKHLKRLPRSGELVEILSSSILNTEPSELDEVLEKGQQNYGLVRKSLRLKKEAPNIFLNLSDRQSRQDLFWGALVGVILQLGVLIISGLITYFPSVESKFKKEGKTPARYAYPFMAGGTVVLVFGMLICSHVVEHRTVEDVFQIQSSQGHIFWLQRGGEVGNQQFDSFAMFARGPRHSIRTSRLIEYSKIESEYQAPGGLVRRLTYLDRLWKTSKELSTSPGISSHYLTYKVIATFGCLISVLGFIIQFIGLRGMHWLATILQLAATIMMTGVRAWVRRDLVLSPIDQQLTFGYELDWIATRIVRDYERLWPDMKNDDKQSLPGKDDGFWGSDCWNWEILSGVSSDGYNLLLAIPQVSDSHSVVTVRKRLGSLSNWSGPVSDLAVSVATVIEAVMNSLCSFSEEDFQLADSMYWSVNSRAKNKNGNNHELIHLKLKKVGQNGLWKADATEIEAVLSLWLYSVQRKECGFSSLQIPKGIEPLVPEEDWLRHGDAAVRQDCLRFLGDCLPDTCRDLIWYMGSQAGRVSIVMAQIEFDKPENDRDFGDADFISVENHRVVGFRDTSDICETSVPVTSVARFKRSMYELWITEDLLHALSKLDATRSLSDIDDLTISPDELAVFPDHDLKLLFAQDLFSTFMWNVAKKMNPVDGKTTVHPTEKGITRTATSCKNFWLENSKLDIALHAFQKAKLGSFEDACLCVIPPLSRARKLPDALPVIEHAQKIAEGFEHVGHLEEAGDIYISLFQISKTFHPTDMFPLKTMGILSEFLAFIHNMVKTMKNQLRDFELTDKIFKLESKLRDHVKTASQSQLDIFSFLYHFQNRDVMKELLETMFHQHDINGIGFNLFNRSEFSRLHPAIKSKQGLLSRNKWEEASTEGDSKDFLEWTPLHYLATGRWPETEEATLEEAKRKYHDSKNLMGWTALHIAAQSGCVSAAQEILQERTQLEARGRDGKRPLHCAIEKSHEVMVEWLIEAGADVEAQDDSRMTPLHWAAYFASTRIIFKLTDAGAKKKSRDDDGRVPLHYAAIAGRYPSLMTELHEEGIIDAKDKRGQTPLCLGVKVGKESGVRWLLDKNADFMTRDNQGNTVLHVAAEAGQTAMAQFLLEMGAGLEAENSALLRPLHAAAKSNQKSVVQLLLDKGADIEARSYSKMGALHLASIHNHVAMVQLLLEKGANIEARDQFQHTPLHLAAAQDGNGATVQILLERGADIEARDVERRTALHIVAPSGNSAMVQILLEKGADIEARDAERRTALHIVAQMKVNRRRALHEAMENASVLKQMLEKGADIEARAQRDERALHMAASRGNVAVVQLLLEEGADIEAQDELGKTALHHAVYYEEVTILLLEKGADFEALNAQGVKALNLIFRAPWRGGGIVRLLAELTRQRQKRLLLSQRLTRVSAGPI